MESYSFDLVLLAALVGIGLLLFKLLRANQWLFKSRLTTYDLSAAFAQHRQQEQHRLYLGTLLDLDPDRLPPSGGWAASADVLTFIAEAVRRKKPQLAVEFGSGISTLVVARCLQMNGAGRLVTYEHDAEFALTTESRATTLGLPTDIRVVQLEPAAALGYPGSWYAAEDVPDNIDLLLIDGPPMSFHPQTRGAAATLFSKLTVGGIVILDDAARPGESAISERWKREFKDIRFEYFDTEKGTLIGVKLGSGVTSAADRSGDRH